MRRRRVRRGRRRLRSALCLFAGGSGSAAAAEYPINNCFADLDTHSSQAFEDFATRGMMWKRACNPEGRGRRGLVTGNVIRSGRVRRGARSYFILRAPAGTRFGRFTWSGQARRRDCRYALQVWASRPDGPTVPIKNVRANEKCPRPGNAQAAGWPKRRTKNVSGSNKIVQRIICVGTNRTPYCSSRGENYIRTLVASATVVDVSPPAIRIIQNNPFTLGQWVSGNQTVSYDTSDNVGVRLAQARDGRAGACAATNAVRATSPSVIPCPNGPGAIRVEHDAPTGGLSATRRFRRLDSAGNIGGSSPVTVRVDNTPPGAVPVAVEGSSGWRNQNGFVLTWTNPPETDRAPIINAFYRLCSADARRWLHQRLPGGCRDNAARTDCGTGSRRVAGAHLATGRCRQPRARQRLRSGDAPVRPRSSPAGL